MDETWYKIFDIRMFWEVQGVSSTNLHNTLSFLHSRVFIIGICGRSEEICEAVNFNSKVDILICFFFRDKSNYFMMGEVWLINDAFDIAF